MDQTVTSGTTGRPKHFALDPDKIAARVARRAAAKGPEYAALKSLFCGVGMRGGKPDTARSVGSTHQAWAQAHGKKFFAPTGNFDKTIDLFNTEQPEGVVTSPLELLKYARAEKRTHKFKYILASGAKLEPKVAQEILEKLLAPGGVAYITYGSSEVGTIARATFAEAIRTPGCVGKPIDGVNVSIDDGQVRVKINAKLGAVDKYADQKLTDKHFKKVGDDLWFYPGDRAILASDGSLVLLGRV